MLGTMGSSGRAEKLLGMEQLAPQEEVSQPLNMSESQESADCMWRRSLKCQVSQGDAT